jgi:transcription antitermination factor NusG
MPLVASEPALFPEALFSDSDALAGRPGRWWAVYTKSRAEKTLARHLLTREVPYYLPLSRNSYRKNGRTFTSYLPLFPGYVFLHANETERVIALESNVVSRILPIPDQARLFADLRKVDRMLAAEAPVATTHEFLPGEPVRIVAGPFEGQSGTLVRHGNQSRLVVEVAFLQQAVWADVEDWMVEPAGRTDLVNCQ